MPTVLVILGWRLFFFANESNEPVHIHACKGDMECKYWLFSDEFEIEESISFNMGPSDKKEIRKIIFEHFDYIISAWTEFSTRRRI
jgi:hypothetical protein